MLALSNRMDQRKLFSLKVRRIISRDAAGAGYNTIGLLDQLACHRRTNEHKLLSYRDL